MYREAFDTATNVLNSSIKNEQGPRQLHEQLSSKPYKLTREIHAQKQHKCTRNCEQQQIKISLYRVYVYT